MNRKGFTLIELLIVVVIIGIWPRSRFEVRQHEGKGVSRLDEVGSPEPRDGEEAYFADSVKYTKQPGYELPTPRRGCPTINVTANGWTATVSPPRHEDLRDLRRYDGAGACQQGRRAEVRVSLWLDASGAGETPRFCWRKRIV